MKGLPHSHSLCNWERELAGSEKITPLSNTAGKHCQVTTPAQGEGIWQLITEKNQLANQPQFSKSTWEVFLSNLQKS